jgi:hypothetical protein
VADFSLQIRGNNVKAKRFTANLIADYPPERCCRLGSTLMGRLAARVPPTPVTRSRVTHSPPFGGQILRARCRRGS